MARFVRLLGVVLRPPVHSGAPSHRRKTFSTYAGHMDAYVWRG